MRSLSLALLLSLAVWLPARAATAFTITLNGYDTSLLVTQARVGSTDSDSDTVDDPGLALPYSYQSISSYSPSFSRSVYDLTNSGFDISFTQQRSFLNDSRARGWGFIYFSVDQDIDYIASGSLSSVNSHYGITLLRSYIYDHTASALVFESFQQSFYVLNESFTLGLTEGEITNVLTGSLSGTLLAGHDYSFFYDATIQALASGSQGGASATGDVFLSFVPEPNTALLLTCGLTGLALRRRFAA